MEDSVSRKKKERKKKEREALQKRTTKTNPIDSLRFSVSSVSSLSNCYHPFPIQRRSKKKTMKKKVS